MIPLVFTRDTNGYPTTGNLTSRKFTDTAIQFELTASTVTTITIPTNPFPMTSSQLSNTTRIACYLTYTPNASVWVQPNTTTTLVLPTTTVTYTTAILNPAAREVFAGQEIQFLTSASNVFVSLELYAIC